MSILKVSDRTDLARSAVVDSVDVAPVVGQWLAADGAASIFTHHLSPNVCALARAVRAADWARVHVLADHLSMDVEVLLP
jgi:hypothetical protein